MLRILYTYALWVYVDKGGIPVYASLTAKRDSQTAQVVLSSTKVKVCTTDKGPLYVSAVRKLPVKWFHETFGRRDVVRRWFFPIKHRLKKFYKRFTWNAKYETICSWLASFITLYTLLEVKS